jgi:hypothetical protein
VILGATVDLGAPGLSLGERTLGGRRERPAFPGGGGFAVGRAGRRGYRT